MSRMGRRSVSPGEAFQNNLGVGAAIGAGAYVVNYVLMFVFVTIDGADTGDEGWKTVGNILYNAQFADSEFTVSFGGESRSESFNFLTDAETSSELASTIPEILYQLAPIVVLVVAGFLVAQQAQATDIGSSVAAAASIIAGTFVLSIVGVFLFEASTSGASVGPELTTGVLLVGIVIPAVGGAIGGVLSDQM